MRRRSTLLRAGLSAKKCWLPQTFLRGAASVCPYRLPCMEDLRTTIVATVGPACSRVEDLRALITAGADVLRINGSHTPLDEIGPWIRRIRRAANSVGSEVAALIDLPGTKVRVSSFAQGGSIRLEEGQRVSLVNKRSGGTSEVISIWPMPFLDQVQVGSRVLLADGRLELSVRDVTSSALDADVVTGGDLLAGKGVDFPGARLPTKVPTTRDRKIAGTALAAGADWVALSFVRDLSDVLRMQRWNERNGFEHTPVAAKIEREDAVEALDGILSKANCALVARGDLGVDVPPERVPSLQRRILDACRRRGRPSIVATEMLESMVERARPTRAEASDVAGAVYQGADGVMLSAETAVGKHPALAVATMARIVRVAESDEVTPYAGSPTFRSPALTPDRPDQQVVHAAVELAASVEADAIVVFTREGASAVRLSKERPRMPILAYAPDSVVTRRLAFAWGVKARRLPAGRTTDAIERNLRRRLRDTEGFPPGARVVLVMGGANDPSGTTSLIKLLHL